MESETPLAAAAGLPGEAQARAAECELSKDEPVQFHEIFWTEVSAHLKLGIPIALTAVCKNAQAISSAVLLGRKDTMLLSAVSLQSAVTIFLDTMIVTGAVQIESLCAMCMGAGNYALAGIYMQMGLLFVTVLYAPFAFLKVATGPLLRFLGVMENLASSAGHLSVLVAPVIVAEMWYHVIRCFYAAQGVVAPDFVLSVVFVVVTSFFIWAGVYWLDMGIPGYALALTVKRITHLLSFVYICWANGYHEKTWPGIQAKALMVAKRWQVFLSMAIPGMVGGFLENIHWGVMAVLAARLGPKHSAAFDLTLQWWFIGCGLAIGIANGTSINMSTYLGQGRANMARAAMYVGICINVAFAATWALLYYFGISYYMHMATIDQGVIDLVLEGWFAPVMAACTACAVCCIYFYDALLKQGNAGAVYTISPITNWFMCIPVSFFLAPSMGITGIAVGLAVADFGRLVCFSYLVLNSDWKQVSQEARARVEKAPNQNVGVAGMTDI